MRRLTLAGAAIALALAMAAARLRRRSRAVDNAVAMTRPPAESGLSVAVLMFTNQSGDAAQDYFSDGLTEDITRALGRFKELTVISYNAVLPFRNKELPPAEIGQALNARYLVSGSVRRMGQRVRVTVQLSDAMNGTQLWSEQYDDELSESSPSRSASPDASPARWPRACSRSRCSRPAQADRQSRCLRHAAARACAQAPIRRATPTAWRARCWSG